MEEIIKFLQEIPEDAIVLHLSHIDLDGYGSSHIVRQMLPRNIVQLNCNYGEIIDTLMDGRYPGSISDYYVLVTDLNLNLDELNILGLSKGWGCIDHHVLNKDIQIENYSTYYLNREMSATKNTFEVLKKAFKTDWAVAVQLGNLVSVIDVYDLWKEKPEKQFNLGILLTNYIYSINFVDNSLILKYTDFLFSTVLDFGYTHTILETEVFYSVVLNEFLFELVSPQEFIDNEKHYLKDDIPSNVKQALLHRTVIDNYCSGENEQYLIYTGISTKITQYLFHIMFKEDKFKDKVLINLSKDGTIAFRSINEKARDLAVLCSGGGHPNAAGGNIKQEMLDNPDLTPTEILIQNLIKG